MTSTTRKQIDEFLACRRLALIGVSRDEKDFSRGLFRELEKRGYDVVPVNPDASEIEGRPCYAQVQDITPPVEGALLLTSPRVTDRVVRDCAKAGVDRIWMHRGEGIGSVSQTAIDFCEDSGIEVVPGFCPYMFLPDTGFIHRAHGFILKLTKSYPT